MLITAGDASASTILASKYLKRQVASQRNKNELGPTVAITVRQNNDRKRLVTVFGISMSHTLRFPFEWAAGKIRT